MNFPSELQPTGQLEIRLSDDKTVSLPMSTPKFQLWGGAPIDFDYGNKPILNYKNEPYFAELVVLRILLEHGWDGVWVETYGGTHYLRSMPQAWSLKAEHISIPKDKEDFLKNIWKTAKTSACFDVLAWKNDEVVFFEAKRSGKDKLTSAQGKFIAGALACGVPSDSLVIVEWSEN